MSDAVVRGTWRPDRRRRPDLSDRIVLANMQFQGRHGVYDHEQLNPQPFEVDVELSAASSRPGSTTTSSRRSTTARSTRPFARSSNSTSFRLLEALAEAISHELLADFDVAEVVVRLRKPEVRLGGPLDYAGVEIRRSRPNGDRRG